MGGHGSAAPTPTRIAARLVGAGVALALLLAACSPGVAHVGAQGPPGGNAPPTGAAPAGGTTAIAIAGFKFAPTLVTVTAGTTVAWTNKDGIAHAVDFSSPDLHSALLNQNDRFTHTFPAPGRYPYICRVHPFMHGTLIVTA